MDHRADPDRHSFLHTPECNILWKRFFTCKTEHPVLKYFDYCSTEYSDVLKCFKKERRQKAAISHKLAMKQISQNIDNFIEKEEQTN